MTIPDSDAVHWIIAPAGRAITYTANETKVASILHRSLIVLEGNETFLRIARERLEAANAREAVHQIEQLITEAPTLRQWASELRANDFSEVNSHSLIGMWGAVEVAVEDTIVLILTKDPAALEIVADTGIRTTTLGSSPLSEDGARRLYGRMERQLRKKLKVGEAYIKLLGLFGVQVSCTNHVLSNLEEINVVRNCLLHRGGVIDDRAAQSVEILKPLMGQEIAITRARYLAYYDAIGAFLKAMLQGVIDSRHIKAAPEISTDV